MNQPKAGWSKCIIPLLCPYRQQLFEPFSPTNGQIFQTGNTDDAF